MKIKKQITRRGFITNTALAGIGTLGAANLLNSCTTNNTGTDTIKETDHHEYNNYYSGRHLDHIAFPIGGIGAGMFVWKEQEVFLICQYITILKYSMSPVCLQQYRLKDLKTEQKFWKGRSLIGRNSDSPIRQMDPEAHPMGSHVFRIHRFTSRFPFAVIEMQDDDIPVSIQLTGWSPFIPADADNSSLPVGALEYSIRNKSESKIEAVFSYNSRNFMSQPNGINKIGTLSNGFILQEEGVKDKPETRGDFAIFTSEPGTLIDHCWFRGGWWDPLTIAWETIMKGEIRQHDPVEKGAPGASLYIPVTLKPGETKVVKLLMAWYVPDTDLKYGKDAEGNDKETCTDAKCSCKDPFYKPWYTSKFKGIEEVVTYWKTNYNDLRSKSVLFRDSFYNSTLPHEVTEAIAANLAILKSPTVLRQPDGKLWSWEGCGDNSGCCAGSCTHVWNYAQAIPHLFPKLERTLRETEFFPSQDKEGHQTFRAALPIRPVATTFYAASDGQLGGIMKMYRDWRISGDNEWMKKMYPQVL